RGEPKGADVGEPAERVDPLDGRARRARTGRDQDLAAAHLPAAGARVGGGDEPRRSLEGVEAGGPEVLDPLLLRLLQRLLPRADAGQVDRRRHDLYPALVCERVDLVRKVGDDQVGLGRRTGDVRAAPAPALVLDQRDFRAVLVRRLLRAVPGRGAGADHDQVVSLHSHRSSRSHRSESRTRSQRYSRAMDDAAVIEALRAGDEGVFADLMRMYNASLLRVAQIYVASRTVAEDVVQDTWI